MEKMEYSPEMKQLISKMLHHQNSQWMALQLLLMLAYFLYAIGQQIRMESPSLWLLFIGQFGIFCLIFLVKHWTERFDAGLFLTEENESKYLLIYAHRIGVNEKWINDQVLKALDDFMLKNGIK